LLDSLLQDIKDLQIYAYDTHNLQDQKIERIMPKSKPMTRNNLKEDDHGKLKDAASKDLKDSPIECDGWCITEKNKSISYKFVWTIEQFSGLFPHGQSTIHYQHQNIESSDFKYKDGLTHDERIWKLKLYPNGTNGNGLVTVCLISTYPGRSQNVTAKYEISILDNNKNKQNTIQGNQVFNAGQSKTLQYSVPRNQLNSHNLLPDDTLTIVCEISEDGSHRSSLMTEGLKKNKKVDPMVPVMLETSVYHKQLFKDMNHVFLNKNNGYDIIIKCGDNSFYCHKFMLSARSPVFQAMFISDMEETKYGTVKVEDVHPDVMTEILQYVYTGCSLNIDKHAEAILAAAEKYLLDQLKVCCEDHLSGILDVENCIELLLLGERNNATALKKAALLFLTDNMTKFIAGDWKQKLKNHPVLVMEVMENLMAKNDK